MDLININQLEKDARVSFTMNTVPLEQFTIQQEVPVKIVQYERQRQPRKALERWITPSNIKLLPKPARPDLSTGPKILSCQIIKPADYITPSPNNQIAMSGNQSFSYNHPNIADNDVSMYVQAIKTNSSCAPKQKIVKKKKQVFSSAPEPIHLLKSGETYHSLGKIEDDKLKIITSALKSIGNPLKSKRKTVYDGATKTRIKYKVIYPEDLNLSESSQITLKEENPKQEAKATKPEPQLELETETTEQDTKDETPVKVTRSGRAVKSPRGRGPQEVEKSPRARRHKFVNMLTCLRCHAKFSGVAKINRHYEQFPTHKPNTTHSNLFKCFLDIMKKTPVDEKSYVFVEQLEELIVNIRNMLPCMVNNIDSNAGKLCCINEDLGRMLDMEPGKYNISFDEALYCYESNREKCKHRLKLNTLGCTSDLNKPSQLWVAKHNEEIAMMSTEETDCARTHSVDKWPAIKKRIKKYLPVSSITQIPPVTRNVQINNSQANEEQVNMTDENNETQVTNVWIVPTETPTKNLDDKKTVFKLPESVHLPVVNIDSQQINAEHIKLNNIEVNCLQTPLTVKGRLDGTEENKTSGSQTHKYHSSHFDIRSSPIKSSTTTFNKILIKGDNFPMFVKLTDQPTVTSNMPDDKSDSCNIPIDISGMFNDMSSDTLNKPLNETIAQSSLDKQRLQSKLYENIPRDLSTSVTLNTLQEETNHNSSNFCNISQNSMCQNDRLLSSGNNQLPQADGLAGLCVNENNLDSSRVGLQLLDHLGSDCLSFTDTELRNASLDLPDLFSFNHPE